MPNVRGKSLIAIVRDIADGYVAVNPLFLKPFDPETIKGLYQTIAKVQTDVRAEKVPAHDIPAMRARNVKLQRLFAAVMIIRNFARERRISLV